MNRLIIFTGGPGAGKTSVIRHLKKLGYTCAPEAGRKVIQDQVATKGRALPWEDKLAFRDAMVQEEFVNYENFKVRNEQVFFDRSIIDSYGYSVLEQLPVSQRLLRGCKELEYCKKVFIFPPWKSIFVNDLERKQDFKEAVATYERMVQAYQKFGYELIAVPHKSVEERTDFILRKVKHFS